MLVERRIFTDFLTTYMANLLYIYSYYVSAVNYNDDIF